MATSLISSVQSMARKLDGVIHGSPSSSSSSDQAAFSSMKKDLESLERTLRRIQAVLSDAEEREIRDASVKLWLKELRWVAYDAENVLGEYQYEILRAEVITSESAEETSSLKRKKPHDDQVSEFMSVLLQLSFPQKIRGITERFEEISKAKNDLQLREEDGSRRHCISHVPQPSSSLVDEFGIFGREHDKEAVIKMLLSDRDDSKISVISIVGMGGLGKTTLAQCVYNDPRISQYFDATGWVCVSEDFDVKRLTGEIIQSIKRKSCDLTQLDKSCDLTQLDALQATLKNIADEKKVLVVLDDVWNEKRSLWESLKLPFLGATRTVVLVTTRNESVAKMMQIVNNIDMYRLHCLPEDISWLLFCHHAFSGRNPEEYPHLVEIGRKIMQKCGGLPLAVKTLGSLLQHYETDEESWREVLESEIWELDGTKDEILPALKLSYYRMPTHLKPCFLFASLYPKGFPFVKDKLIKMWMAQGYILPRGNKRLEDIGSEYFDELQRRSLFLEYYAKKYTWYVLHDIVHDLARYVSENEHHSIVLESNGEVYPIPAEVRHLYVRHRQGTRFEQLSLENTKDLRTLIYVVDYPLDVVDLQLEHLIHLRVLKTYRASCSFGNLKHLCYLECLYFNDNYGLSSPSHLYNMQTLFLHKYDDHQPFVGSIRHLAKPRYSMLSKLVEITLEGSTEWFSSLHLGQLSSVRYLKFIRMPWSTMPGGHVRKSVTTSNVGFPCLEELIFSNIPNWEEWSGVTDGDFPCLRKLSLKDCPLLRGLPMLPSSLQSLHIFCCDHLKSLPVNHGQVRFPCMKELVLVQMNIWEEWPGLNSGDFPCLCKLTIAHCNKLRRFPLLPPSLDENHGHVRFPCLEEMVLKDIPELQQEWYGITNGYFPCLRTLKIKQCQKLQGFPTLPSSLENLSIKSCWSLASLTGLQNLTSLQSLELEKCPNLHICPQEGLPSKPQHVKIVDCLGLQEWCDMHQFDCIQESYGLAELTIYESETIIKDLGADNLTSLKRLTLTVGEIHLPPDGWLPPMIQILEVSFCNFLESFSLHQNLLLLTRLGIWNCPVLASFDGLHNLPNLEELSFENCPKLQLLTDNSLPSSLQSLSVRDCKELRSLPLLHEKLSSLEKLEVFNCPDLTIMAGLHNLFSLKTLIINQCPGLWLSSDEQLPSMPHCVFIAHCPALRGWCQEQSIPYNQSYQQEKKTEEEIDDGKGKQIADLAVPIIPPSIPPVEQTPIQQPKESRQ